MLAAAQVWQVYIALFIDKILAAAGHIGDTRLLSRAASVAVHNPFGRNADPLRLPKIKRRMGRWTTSLENCTFKFWSQVHESGGWIGVDDASVS